MFLIPSAAYIDSEFQAEIGRLPPCLLPVGNRRLVEWQVQTITNAFKRSASTRIYVSLPSGFKLDPKDCSLLSKLNIEIIWIPQGLSLGESIFSALEAMPSEGAVSILYGDTLIQDLPKSPACLAVAETRENYDWYVDKEQKGSDRVWAGYFRFTSKKNLMEALKVDEFDFLNTTQRLFNQGYLNKERVNRWYDAGHINTYFYTRGHLTSERAFNTIRISKNVVTKSSQHSGKVAAEASWFEQVPPSIKRLTPNLIDSRISRKDTYYSIEYLSYLPLNELAVHGRLPVKSWAGIFNACLEYFEEASQAKPPEGMIKQLEKDRAALIELKTRQRLAEFEEYAQINLHKSVELNGRKLPSIYEMVDDLIAVSIQNKSHFSVVHGDFCFSNIIYDSRSKVIKLIDPRGINSFGEPTIYGDLVYDLAKFSHSVMGFYDFILAGAFSLEINGQSIQFEVEVNDVMDELISLMKGTEVIKGIDVQDVMPLVILLFLSMLPLHADSIRRQHALLANALRLYCDYKGIV